MRFDLAHRDATVLADHDVLDLAAAAHVHNLLARHTEATGDVAGAQEVRAQWSWPNSAV